MKKELFFILIVFGFGSYSIAQSDETSPRDSIPWELRKQLFIYSTAQLFNDPVVTRMALYNLLAESPLNVAIYDSLALSYLQYNQNASAALVAQQVLTINTNDMLAVEIAATAFDALGVKDKAVSYYEKMYLNNGDLNTLYKVSFLQFELERYTEANTSLDIIIGDSLSKELTIHFPTTDGSSQEVYLYVAAYRVKAMIEEEKGNVEVAKTKYLEILKMKPGLQIIQQQLRAIMTKGEDAKKE